MQLASCPTHYWCVDGPPGWHWDFISLLKNNDSIQSQVLMISQYYDLMEYSNSFNMKTISMGECKKDVTPVR